MTSPARAAAETYRASVNAKDLDLLRTIFAPDVELFVPTMALDLKHEDGVFRGIDEAMEFFATTSFPAQATLTYTHVYETERSCIVELEGLLPAGNTVALAEATSPRPLPPVRSGKRTGQAPPTAAESQAAKGNGPEKGDAGNRSSDATAANRRTADRTCAAVFPDPRRDG